MLVALYLGEGIRGYHADLKKRSIDVGENSMSLLDLMVMLFRLVQAARPRSVLGRETTVDLVWRLWVRVLLR